MVYKLDGGTVIDAEGNLVVENLYVDTDSVTPVTNATSGSVSAYVSGGIFSPPTQRLNTIDKFPFATDANATDVGDLIYTRVEHSGHFSTTHAYAAGGISPNSPASKPSIDRWPFASDENAVDYGDLHLGMSSAYGGLSSETDGYITGGSAASPPYSNRDVIQKFPFVSTGSEADVGDLTQGRQSISNQNSGTFGYISGGHITPSANNHQNIIEKFPFASGGNASDVGDLTAVKGMAAGNQSLTHGYVLGGNTDGPSNINVIEKFPFSTDANGADVGDLIQNREHLAGASSSSSGYGSGGRLSSIYKNEIQKHPFAADANASDIADLTQARNESAGHQV